jgi:hypothetical protein
MVKNVANELADNGSSIIKLAIILVVAIVIVWYVPSLFHVTPVVEVSNCGLSSDTITNNGQTTLSFTLKSNDADNIHTVRVEFSSHELVSFMLGSQPLPNQNNLWIYTENLNPSATHSQSIIVKGALENGIAKLDYRIDVTFYVDGKEIETKSLDLTVKR